MIEQNDRVSPAIRGKEAFQRGHTDVPGGTRLPGKTGVRRSRRGRRISCREIRETSRAIGCGIRVVRTGEIGGHTASVRPGANDHAILNLTRSRLVAYTDD